MMIDVYSKCNEMIRESLEVADQQIAFKKFMSRWTKVQFERCFNCHALKPVAIESNTKWL